MFALCTGGFLYYIRLRIGFASVNLRIACEAISVMPKIFAYAAAVMAVEFLWCLLWSMAVYGVSTNAADDTIQRTQAAQKNHEEGNYRKASEEET